MQRKISIILRLTKYSFFAVLQRNFYFGFVPRASKSELSWKKVFSHKNANISNYLWKFYTYVDTDHIDDVFQTDALMMSSKPMDALMMSSKPMDALMLL